MWYHQSPQSWHYGFCGSLSPSPPINLTTWTEVCPEFVSRNRAGICSHLSPPSPTLPRVSQTRDILVPNTQGMERGWCWQVTVGADGPYRMEGLVLSIYPSFSWLSAWKLSCVLCVGSVLWRQWRGYVSFQSWRAACGCSATPWRMWRAPCRVSALACWTSAARSFRACPPEGHRAPAWGPADCWAL